MFAIERAVGRTANRHLRILYRWQQHTPGVLDVFAAHEDRRSLRALLRGAVQGASSEARLDGLLPTPTLPLRALMDLAHQASPADVVRQLALLAHPGVHRLLPLTKRSQMDLLGVDLALLLGFAERATRAAADNDQPLREFVGAVIDIGNVQNALLMSGGPGEFEPTITFVPGGRWLSMRVFVSAAKSVSQQAASTTLATALARSPFASLLSTTTDVAQLDRAFLRAMLGRLTAAARLEPLSTAPLLRVLLLIEAQSRDLRALAWGAALNTPASLRKQQLVTPS